MIRKLKHFHSAIDSIRAFVEPDSGTEIMRRLISSLQDQVYDMQTKHDQVEDKIDKMMRIMLETQR